MYEKSFPTFPAFTSGKGIYFPAFAAISKMPIIPAFPALLATLHKGIL